ncbi:ABC transporter permease [Chloroflexota bacterium]
MWIAATINRIRKTLAAKRRPPIVPLIIVLALVLTGIFGPLFAPYSPYKGALSDRLLPPFWQDGGSTEHLLGTDVFGRDVLTRLIYGARVSLAVSLLTLLIASVIGSFIGLVSGYFGGWVDAIIMRVVDLMLSLPNILIAFVIVAVFGPSLTIIVLVVVLVVWARYARQVRAEVLSIKERDFVALARTAGCSHLRIIFKHIFPNVTNTLIVIITLQVGWVILLEASLSFLGVGIPPPTPAWGVMVADGRAIINSAWWISTIPGIAILLVVLSLNLFGDWLRDVLDPKMRQI